MKKFISQEDMKLANIFEVLSLIRREGALTRKEIQESMGLSWGGVSQIVARLLDIGYVREVKKTGEVCTGRTPSAIMVNTEDNFFLGVDVNKSGIYAKAIDLAGNTVLSEGGRANAENKESFLQSIFSLLDGVREKLGGKTVLAAGVAMQGRVDSEKGISEHINIPGWENIAIAELLKERYGYPFYIMHDPDCILSAATSKDKSAAVLVRVDNGLGMAVYKDGRLITGRGMLEIGNAICSHGGRLGERLVAVDDIGRDFAEVLVNLLIIFDIYNVILCGEYVEGHKDFCRMVEEELSAAAGVACSVTEYDVKNAAIGAALFATEVYLQYI